MDRIARPYFQRTGSQRTPIYEEDWDNLIILDACRYDLFNEAVGPDDLPGESSDRLSLGSATPEYLAANFSGKTFHDIVYVTANPYVNTNLEHGMFHDVVSVWKEGWNEDLQVVTPESMLEQTRAAAETYPNKRLIAHFTQPHVPFIGEERLGQRKVSNIRRRAAGKERVDKSDREPTPFEMLARGEVSKSEVWTAYISNLERVLPSINTLLKELDGMTAVSSDHGNGLGEFATPFPVRVYGHPVGIHTSALTRVPWHVYQNGNRREIEAESPIRQDISSHDDVNNRLRMLGYKE